MTIILKVTNTENGNDSVSPRFLSIFTNTRQANGTLMMYTYTGSML